MFDGARGPLLTPILLPDVAVDRAWQAMLSGKAMRLTPWTVGFARMLKGVLPLPVWDAVADRVFGVYSTMEDFRGHSRARDAGQRHRSAAQKGHTT